MFEPILVIFLLLCSAFFSGSETGLTAVSRARIYQLVQEGNARARKVLHLREHKEQLIGALLMGNTLVNIAAASVSTSVAIHYFGDEGVIFATAVTTLLVLIFAEVLPKTYAIQQPERFALFVAPVVTLIVRLLSPATTAIQWLIKLLFHIFGVDVHRNNALISSSDIIRGTIELQHKEGDIVKQEKDMLGGILDLEKVEVGDIMVHRKQIETIDAEAAVRDIIRQVTFSTHSRIPFWKDDPDNIIGLLHVRDMFKLLAEIPPEKITHAMILGTLSEPWFIPETTLIGEQLLEFRRRRRHFAHVVDEYGAFLGIITLEDILEEIVGDISDEYDRPSAIKLKQQADGSYLVEGTMMIRDFNRELDWSLPDEHASTLAGLVIHEARMIPEKGAVFAFFGCEFEIVDKRANQILKLRIRKVSGGETDGDGI